MAKQDVSYASLLNDINNKRFKPVYFLMGEEPYYIDLLTDAIIKNALLDSERDFNQTILYGADTTIGAVINAAKRYPMMAERQLIVVKEAQALKAAKEEDEKGAKKGHALKAMKEEDDEKKGQASKNVFDALSFYLQKPLSSTILVFNYKYGTLDGRKKVSLDLAKTGVVFESKKLNDNQIPAWIHTFVSTKGYTIDGKAKQMIAEFLGTDLSRIAGELNKLLITMPPGEKRITDTLVERNIGISKEYNVFELIKALAAKDILKANRIVDHFGKNPKTTPLVMVLSLLFPFFANMMLCHYAVNKSESGIMKELGLRYSIQVNDYIIAMRNYSGAKIMQIIALLREYDAKGKGFKSMPTPDGELLKELVYKIMH
ncbi:MAG: DNA polymerase III subunit delta [Bacteroidales bacterium]|jgi:DNA polymerase-3 subunit delta|nr:DNA polymerase III subunit delta [Bacteroidales bacterium]